MVDAERHRPARAGAALVEWKAAHFVPPIGYDGNMCQTMKLPVTHGPLQLLLRACLIAAAASSCGSATLVADETIRPVVDTWQSRADEVHTVRFKAQATVLIPQGALGPMNGSSVDSLTGPIDYPIDEGSIDYPLEDETYEDSVEGLIDFQNNKLRISTHYHAFDDPLHQFIPQFKVEYFNGNRTVETRPRAENTSERYTPYKYETQAFIRPQNEALGFQEILPIFFSCGALPSILWPSVHPIRQAIDVETLADHGGGTFGGFDCTILRTKEDRNRYGQFEEYWVANQPRSPIVKWTLLGSDGKRMVAAIEIHGEQGQQGWVPKHWISTRYRRNRDDPNSSHLIHSANWTVTSYDVNVPTGPSDFEAPYEAGEIVRDVAAGAELQVQSDGKTLKPFVEPVESRPASPLRWIVIGATAIVVVLLIYRTSRRCPSGTEARSSFWTRWLRFSLRTLLLLITAICIWLGMNVPAARRQKEAVPVLLKAGAIFGYDYEFVPTASALTKHGRWDPEQSPPGPTWLRERVGEDYFQTVVAVFFNRPNLAIKKADLDQLAKLPHITELVFDGRGTSVRDQDFTALAELHQLELLQFMRARIDGSILKSLPNPTRLKSLYLGMTDVDDAALAAIEKMTGLESLFLYDTHITDAGLEHLQTLTKLESLWLNQTQLTDAGLQHLARLKKLTLLSLERTKVSKAGVSALRTELPKANIIWP